MTEYTHTQRGRLHHASLIIAAIMLVGAWLAWDSACVAELNLILSAVFIALAFLFASLTVRDGGEFLLLRYGPIPLLRKKIRYADITSVEPDRTKIVDGWGIHYVPGRGWTYNLWDFDCVKLTLGKKVIRVGTDDVENLVDFLRKKISANAKPG